MDRNWLETQLKSNDFTLGCTPCSERLSHSVYVLIAVYETGDGDDCDDFDLEGRCIELAAVRYGCKWWVIDSDVQIRVLTDDEVVYVEEYSGSVDDVEFVEPRGSKEDDFIRVIASRPLA